jgi:site-specific DNA recombinase
MSAPTPCIVYAARSAEDEDEKSTGSQTAEVLKRIEAEGDRDVIGEFAESGKSGYHGERGPELDAAMAAAEAAAADYGEAELWVFHSSRLARGDGTKGRRSLNLIHAQLLYENVRVRSVADDEFVRNPMLVGIASEQNHKYSKDHGAHVARGKGAAVEAGRWPGGPAPDGYLIERSLDERGKTLAKLVPDPERAQVVGIVFDLSEEGIGDPTIARRLNEAGHRTKAGKPWTRRRVQATLTNHVYAGRVVRWGRGSHRGGDYERLDTPETFPGEHPALIEPPRFDRILAARAKRDNHRDRGKRGGRPTGRYALAKLAVCERCGSPMYASTSPYKRKDGSHRRSYQCANVKFATGLCDQPTVSAEQVDAAVVDYLDRLFVDVKEWAAELARGAEIQRAGLDAAVAAERDKLDRADRSMEKARARYRRALDADRETEVEVTLALMDDLKAEAEQARDGLRSAQEKRAALEAEPSPTDAALDLHSELAKAVRGGDGSLADLNERLRQEFDEFRLDAIDGETVGVQPILKARPFDVGTALAAWAEAGEFAPSPEEVEAHEAAERASDPILVGQRPPALPLEVTVKNLPDHHSYLFRKPKPAALTANQP